MQKVYPFWASDNPLWTFPLNAPKWAVIVYINFFIWSYITQDVWNLFPANLLCVCLSWQCTMRDAPNTSYSYFQSGLKIVIYYIWINSRKVLAKSTQVSESGFLTVMRQLGPISTSLTLDEARQALLVESYTLFTNNALYQNLLVSLHILSLHKGEQLKLSSQNRKKHRQHHST